MVEKSVCRQTVTVALENGLHMVPCSRIVQTASDFSCEIRIHKDKKSADAKAVLDLLALEATQGSTLMIEATGDGAEEAVRALVNLFESNFAE